MKAPQPLLYVTLDTEVEVSLYVRVVENGHLSTVYPVVGVSILHGNVHVQYVVTIALLSTVYTNMYMCTCTLLSYSCGLWTTSRARQW